MWNWRELQVNGIRAGLRLSEFWDCTPYEYGLYLEAWTDEISYQQQRDVVLAWNSANFGNAKKLPPLKGILNKMQPEKTMKMFTDERLAKIEEIKCMAEEIDG